MSCPHLKEVRMVFCGAYPVKKLVPVDQLVSASSCETACAFEACPAYQDARARVVQAVDEAELVEALTDHPLASEPAPGSLATSTKGRTP